MNFNKRSATSMPLILLLLSILSISVFHDNAFAQNTGMEISANASEGSTTISINGETNRSGHDITLIVTAPNGNRVGFDQLTPDADGNFMTEFKTGSPLWKQDGVYTITVQQGESAQYKASVEVEVIDGVVIPEFGTIAAMILVIAIISIIAVSAKTRLSIIPKY